MNDEHNPFRDHSILYPILAARVEQARVAQQANTAERALGGAGLNGLVRERTAEAKDHGSLGDDGLEQIANRDIKLAFEGGFKGAEQLFERVALQPPTAEQFAEVGVDFAALAQSYERMEHEGLEPAVVVSPSLPLTSEDSGDTTWRTMYDELTADTTIPNNPLKARSDGNGFWLDDGIASDAQRLLQQERERTIHSSDIHYVETETGLWTIALLPSTNAPQELGTPHTNHEPPGHGDPEIDKHQTISQYLTLQATKIQAGRPPIDVGTYSWLQGTSEDGVLAPYGIWIASDGQVLVLWDDVGRELVSLGVRLPEWG